MRSLIISKNFLDNLRKTFYNLRKTFYNLKKIFHTWEKLFVQAKNFSTWKKFLHDAKNYSSTTKDSFAYDVKNFLSVAKFCLRDRKLFRKMKNFFESWKTFSKVVESLSKVVKKVFRAWETLKSCQKHPQSIPYQRLNKNPPPPPPGTPRSALPRGGGCRVKNGTKPDEKTPHFRKVQFLGTF